MNPPPIGTPDAQVAARVAGEPVTLEEVDARERALRSGHLAATLPAAGTSEGRQLRRWLTQLLATELLVRLEAGGLDPATGPDEHELLPDATARMELGSVASAVLSTSALARALYAKITAGISAPHEEIAAYHERNPHRFARPRRDPSGWTLPAMDSPPLAEVRDAIERDLTAAARRRAFATWLDARRAQLVALAPGYEHPGDPRQPDNTHRH